MVGEVIIRMTQKNSVIRDNVVKMMGVCVVARTYVYTSVSRARNCRLTVVVTWPTLTPAMIPATHNTPVPPCQSTIRERSIVMSVSVCLSVCRSVCVFVGPRSHLRNYTCGLHQIFCPCYLRPRLGPPLTAY